MCILSCTIHINRNTNNPGLLSEFISLHESKCTQVVLVSEFSWPSYGKSIFYGLDADFIKFLKNVIFFYCFQYKTCFGKIYFLTRTLQNYIFHSYLSKEEAICKFSLHFLYTGDVEISQIFRQFEKNFFQKFHFGRHLLLLGRRIKEFGG